MLSKKYFFFFMSFWFFSCASTNITSFKDPDYKHIQFKNILVIANTSDLEKRKKIEFLIVKKLYEVGISSAESYKLFPPTRLLSENDKIDIMVKYNIDSFLSISIAESGVSNVTVPVTSTTTKTKGNVNVYGNTANYKEKSTTTYQGGQTFSKPWANYEASLYDVSNGRMAWIASAKTGGNAYANFNTVMHSFCSKVVEKLIEDRLINVSKDE